MADSPPKPFHPGSGDEKRNQTGEPTPSGKPRRPGARDEESPAPARGRIPLQAWWVEVWKGALAFLGCLALVGLPPARAYSDPGWTPWLAAGTLVGAGLVWWMARKAAAIRVSPGEVIFVGVGGAFLTVLFWVRAHLGVPGVMLGDLPLRLTAQLGGWAWPALLLVVLYRRGGEGIRVGGARRAGLLLALGLAAGSVGFLVHYPVLEVVEERAEVARALERPLESPGALALTGGPRHLAPEPPGVVFVLSTPRGREARDVTVAGRVFPGIPGDVSDVWQGTRLASDDSAVVGVEVGSDGRWRLHPEGPGGAVVTVQNRRVRSWIGVWVLEEGRTRPGPPVEVTDQIRVQAGAVRTPREGFAELQTLTIRNASDDPVLGPIHLVFRSPDSPIGLVGASRTRDPAVLEAFDTVLWPSPATGPRPTPATGPRPTPATVPEPIPVTVPEPTSPRAEGLPWVEVVPGPIVPRNPAPVLAPGASASVEVSVTGAIDLEAPGVSVRVFRSLHGL